MESSLLAILRSLMEERVDFILVGGLAAVLQGAPVHTFDVDIVFSQAPANIDRVSSALDSLDAIFRMQPDRKLRPNVSNLTGSGHLNLVTKYGPLDLLTNIGDRLGYESLLPLSRQLRIGDEQAIRVLRLETLIDLKEKLAGDKDLATLPILRRTLSESKQKD
jgi:predicted nucleotidyltransferase